MNSIVSQIDRLTDRAATTQHNAAALAAAMSRDLLRIRSLSIRNEMMLVSLSMENPPVNKRSTLQHTCFEYRTTEQNRHEKRTP